MHNVATYCNCASAGVGISRPQNLALIPNRFQIETNAWRKPEIGRTGCELLLPLLPQGGEGRGEEAVWNPSLRLSPRSCLAGREGAWPRPPARKLVSSRSHIGINSTG